MSAQNLAKVLRYVLTAIGGAGMASSDDVLVQVASCLIALANLGYSIYKDHHPSADSMQKPNEL